MASEKSPRLLLLCVQELFDNLHEHSEIDEAVIESSGKARNAGFILSRAEQLLLDIRRQLDVPCEASSSSPLMVRIKDHVSSIALVLTGTGIDTSDTSSTTLQELIRNVQHLNRSVCSVNDPTCSIQ